MALPVFFGLKSNYNNKYLQYVKEDTKAHGFVQFSGQNLVSPYTKFQVEKAKSGEGLVHIRSCYNNKYLRRQSPNHWWIVAGADEPEEDKSKWSCTLFEPLAVEGTKFRLRHVQLGHYACLWRLGSDNVYDSCLFAESKSVDNKDQCDVFTIIDWDLMHILPTYVAFKGDNGCYLGVHELNGNPYLQFLSTDISPAEKNQVITTADGSLRIFSEQNQKFWKRTSNDLNWIWVDSDASVKDDSLFWAIKVKDNTIALKNLGTNNLFCTRFSSSNIKDCLSANSNTISPEASLEVEDLAKSRLMNDVNYHLEDARVYNQSINQVLAGGTLVNKTKKPVKFDVKLNYIESKSQAWNANVSPMSGVNTDIHPSVPVIANGKVEILDKATKVFEWGKTIESDNISEVVYDVIVPPMTQVKVSLLATKGSCDVPFSYYQLDTIINGNVITLKKDDGIYTGTNYYNLKPKTEEEKLVEN